jgi:hypothetical protein
MAFAALSFLAQAKKNVIAASKRKKEVLKRTIHFGGSRFLR